MPTTQTASPKMSRQSQAQRVLDVLKKNDWVSAWTLSHFALSYTRRIHELRRAGYRIEMRDEHVNGQRRTAYRLLPEKS